MGELVTGVSSAGAANSKQNNTEKNTHKNHNNVHNKKTRCSDSINREHTSMVNGHVTGVQKTKISHGVLQI